MTKPVLKLFGTVILLFALLIAWTTRWTVIDAKSLRTNPLNTRTLVDELKIKRGRILAADGNVLARSVPASVAATWARQYPTSDLFAQPVGYANVLLGQSAGLERSRGEELRGIQRGLSTIFGQLTRQRVGDDVYTTLDTKAQQLAKQDLAGQPGAVVAVNPKTGAVEVMYANPSYDDNHPQAPCSNACQINRSVFAAYPPGSTFKVVTATAAIDTGKYQPSSTVNGDSPKTISGVPLNNDNNQSFGDIDLTTALTYSVNTVWAQVGVNLGRATMAEYMKRFGFYSRPPLDYPPDEMSSSGERKNGRLLSPVSPQIDVGRMAIGQDKLAVTPMQMAMVAAAVANRGALMTPHLAARVVDQDGRTVETIAPTVMSQVMKPSTAAAVTNMMKNVVEEGTGTPAQLNGINVAGKTGTAQVGAPGSGLTQPWFIGFAPVENPRVAVAVTVERSQGGFGGTVAAPIARDIIQQLLSEPPR